MRFSQIELKDQYGTRKVLGKPFLVASKNAGTPHGYQSRSYVVVQCECGRRDVVSVHSLLKGTNTCKACASTTHGHNPRGSRSKVYTAWQGIKQRASNRSGCSPTYSHIDMDPTWYESFETFYADVGDPPSPQHSIDRVDNAKGYWPNNCRWATKTEQNLNRDVTRMLSFNGVTKPLVEFAAEVGIAVNTVRTRIDVLGWSVERALSMPVRQRRYKTESLKT